MKNVYLAIFPLVGNELTEHKGYIFTVRKFRIHQEDVFGMIYEQSLLNM